MTRGAERQPAKGSVRVRRIGNSYLSELAQETREFANKRDKRRRAKQLAKIAKQKQRKVI